MKCLCLCLLFAWPGAADVGPAPTETVLVSISPTTADQLNFAHPYRRPFRRTRRPRRFPLDDDYSGGTSKLSDVAGAVVHSLHRANHRTVLSGEHLGVLGFLFSHPPLIYLLCTILI